MVENRQAGLPQGVSCGYIDPCRLYGCTGHKRLLKIKKWTAKTLRTLGRKENRHERC